MADIEPRDATEAMLLRKFGVLPALDETASQEEAAEADALQRYEDGIAADAQLQADLRQAEADYLVHI